MAHIATPHGVYDKLSKNTIPQAVQNAPDARRKKSSRPMRIKEYARI